MENADVTIGYNTYISMDVKIYSQHSIAIGSYSTIGWGSQIVDSDLHDVIDINTGVAFPQGKRIIIGDHVWVCNSCSITKGTVIPNDVIVGARSLCNKEYDVPRYSVIAGTPAKYIKEGLRYEH